MSRQRSREQQRLDLPPNLSRLRVAEPKAGDSDLSRRAVRGGTLTVTTQIVKFVVQTASTILLARLLLPEDFGLLAMVLVFTTLAGILKDLGLTTATLQSPTITQGQASNLLWINVALGSGIALAFAASAPLVARFYGEPAVVEIMLVLAPIFILNGLTAQHLALMRRAMSYGRVAIIELGGQVTAATVAITMASIGFGYWSLVALQALGAPVVLILAWTLSGWRPSRPTRGQGIRQLLSFGGYLTGFTFLNYFTSQADKALIGWALGAGSLGIYTKAYNLFQLPMRQLNPPIGAVALPTLSRLRSVPEEYRRAYLRTVVLLAYLSMPGIAVAAGAADLAIPVILGEQWTPSAPVFRYLALGGILGPVLWTAGWVHQSLGRADRQFRWSIMSDPLYVLSFFVGFRWGIEGVALAFAITVAALFIPTMHYALAPSAVRTGEVVRAISRPLTLSIALFATMRLTWSSVGLDGPQGLVALLGIAVVTCLVALLVWKGLRDEVRQQFRAVRHLRAPSA